MKATKMFLIIKRFGVAKKKLEYIKETKCMRIRKDLPSKGEREKLCIAKRPSSESYFPFSNIIKFIIRNKIDDFVFLYTSQYKLLFAYRIDASV